MSSYDAIKLDIANGVATLTLSRPDRMNAFNEPMMREMIAAFDVTDADDSVRAVIVTGEGRAFCAGADLASAGDTFNYEKRLAGRGEEFDEDRVRDGGGRVGIRIYESTKPVIAAINGAAVGVGATMTLPMDVRLAVEGAKMGFALAAGHFDGNGYSDLAIGIPNRDQAGIGNAGAESILYGALFADGFAAGNDDFWSESNP